MSTSTSAPLSIRKAVSEGDDEAVFAIIASAEQGSLSSQLEKRKSTTFYDCDFEYTVLGEALCFYSSVAVIDALLKNGASPYTTITRAGLSKDLLKFIANFRKNEVGDEIQESWWMEFCGRCPTHAWCNEVEALVVAAKNVRAGKA